MTNSNYLKQIAYTMLLREGIRYLPLNPVSLVRRKTYRLKSYHRIAPPNESPEVIVEKYGNAFVAPSEDSKHDAPYILGVNTSCSRLEREWALLHELAHIELGHVIDIMSYSGYDEAKNAMENEARALVFFMACPDVILEHLNVKTANEISIICNIPYKEALKKAQYFKSVGYRLNSLKPESPLEKRLVYMFRDYIENYHSKKHMQWEVSTELCF